MSIDMGRRMVQWLEKRDTLDIPSQSALSLAWEKEERMFLLVKSSHQNKW